MNSYQRLIDCLLTVILMLILYICIGAIESNITEGHWLYWAGLSVGFLGLGALANSILAEIIEDFRNHN